MQAPGPQAGMVRDPLPALVPKRRTGGRRPAGGAGHAVSPGAGGRTTRSGFAACTLTAPTPGTATRRASSGPRARAFPRRSRRRWCAGARTTRTARRTPRTPSRSGSYGASFASSATSTFRRRRVAAGPRAHRPGLGAVARGASVRAGGVAVGLPGRAARPVLRIPRPVEAGAAPRSGRRRLGQVSLRGHDCGRVGPKPAGAGADLVAVR
jgi:hypothetical protein